jgi:hypothetical protein
MPFEASIAAFGKKMVSPCSSLLQGISMLFPSRFNLRIPVARAYSVRKKSDPFSSSFLEARPFIVSGEASRIS